jgi:hypothetical protein
MECYICYPCCILAGNIQVCPPRLRARPNDVVVHTVVTVRDTFPLINGLDFPWDWHINAQRIA